MQFCWFVDRMKTIPIRMSHLKSIKMNDKYVGEGLAAKQK